MVLVQIKGQRSKVKGLKVKGQVKTKNQRSCSSVLPSVLSSVRQSVSPLVSCYYQTFCSFVLFCIFGLVVLFRYHHIVLFAHENDFTVSRIKLNCIDPFLPCSF